MIVACMAYLFFSIAKKLGFEVETAKSRLEFWISRSAQSPTSHDAVDGFKNWGTILLLLKVMLLKEKSSIEEATCVSWLWPF
ncbi:hypothetical protein L1987_70799 [Smallanthus sonchifolius]|uniref:Uncharacterized protein n=1 Tax=Smallanthus sonchifolius TaxID=185202 RepID=A0ACB9AS94_9ASTR|nr:hypothetical protein L1987_70799 [Smallanthus sonchifolius]